MPDLTSSVIPCSTGANLHPFISLLDNVLDSLGLANRSLFSAFWENNYIIAVACDCAVRGSLYSVSRATIMLSKLLVTIGGMALSKGPGMERVCNELFVHSVHVKYIPQQTYVAVTIHFCGIDGP